MYEIFVKHHFSSAHKLIDYEENVENYMGITGKLKYMHDQPFLTISEYLLILRNLKRSPEKK